MAFTTITKTKRVMGAATISTQPIAADGVTFTYLPGRGEEVVFKNKNGTEPKTITIKSDAQTLFVPGVGDVDVSDGKEFVVPADGALTVRLDEISGVLKANGPVYITADVTAATFIGVTTA